MQFCVEQGQGRRQGSYFYWASPPFFFFCIPPFAGWAPWLLKLPLHFPFESRIYGDAATAAPSSPARTILMVLPQSQKAHPASSFLLPLHFFFLEKQGKKSQKDTGASLRVGDVRMDVIKLRKKKPGFFLCGRLLSTFQQVSGLESTSRLYFGRKIECSEFPFEGLIRGCLEEEEGGSQRKTRRSKMELPNAKKKAQLLKIFLHA